MIRGSFVALVTPFNADESVDYAAFAELLDWQRSHGTSAVLIMGSTGEVSMLSAEERREIMTRTVAMKSSDMEIWYGCTGGSTAQTIGYLKHAKSVGADGAILAAPAYICAPEADIEAYFLECADSVDLPMGIYNNPPRVKTDLHWSNLLRIMEHPNVQVLKESTARVGQVAQILKANPTATVMCCDSPNLGLVVPTMSLGGHGTANVSGNIDPLGMAQLSAPWDEPQQAMVFKETYLRLLPLLHFNYSAINPVAVKSLLKAVGMPVGELRKPLTRLSEAQLALGLEVVRLLGLDRAYGWSIKKAA